jgi:DNA-binding IclR family transcriptional regulator
VLSLLDVVRTDALGTDRAAETRRHALDDRKFVTALARGLDVLSAFTPSDGLLGNQEIAARTGLPKPTVSRLTYTLTKLGYLAHVERFGKYQLAPGAISLGYTALANMGIRNVARPLMQKLADDMAGSVALGAYDRHSVLYIEYCTSNSPVALRLEVGSRIPMATTSAGRALLAVLPASVRDAILDDIARTQRSEWPQLKDAIERAALDLAERGFAISAGDWYPDVNAAAVPLVLPDGSGAFALNCGAPAFRLSRERLINEVGPQLVETAYKIERLLGGEAGAWRRTIKQETSVKGGTRDMGNERGGDERGDGRASGQQDSAA